MQKSLGALAEETGLSSDTVYYYLQDFLSLGIASRSKEGIPWISSAGRFSYDFGLSEAMWVRGRTTKILRKAEMGMLLWWTSSSSS